jgi:hypothetical protein
MKVLPIEELPLRYLDNAECFLGIDASRQEPRWFIVQWFSHVGRYMVMPHNGTWLTPTHFIELPQVPA